MEYAKWGIILIVLVVVAMFILPGAGATQNNPSPDTALNKNDHDNGLNNIHPADPQCDNDHDHDYCDWHNDDNWCRNHHNGKNQVDVKTATVAATYLLGEISGEPSSDYTEWSEATVIKNTTYYDMNGVESAYSFNVTVNGQYDGYIIVSATTDNYPVLEFSKGMTPDTDPAALADARMLAQSGITPIRQVLGKGQPIYLGATFYDMAYPVELNTTRPGPQPSTNTWILVDLVNHNIVNQTVRKLNATERREQEQLQQQKIAEAHAEWATIENAAGTGSGFAPTRTTNIVKNAAAISTGGQPTGVNPIYGVPAYMWRYGCSPTSAAMILGYWENQGLTQLPAVTDSTYGNPLNQDLAGYMHTDYLDDGYNWYCVLDPLDPNCGGTTEGNQILGVDGLLNHFLNPNGIVLTQQWFAREVPSDTSYSSDTTEIDSGYPFVLNMMGGGSSIGSSSNYGDHSVAVIGYNTAANTLIIHDTWSTTPVQIRYGNWQSAWDDMIEHVSDYTITTNPGPGGTITPPGPVVVVPDFSQSFSITPSPGYVVGDVHADIDDEGAVSSYTFTNVIKKHAVSAIFNPVITTRTGPGGSISPSGSVPVTYGSGQTFTIIPADGYSITDVLIDGNSVGAVSSYSLSAVTTPHTISATFTSASPVITAYAGSGGSISPSGAVPVPYGSSETFTISTNSGWTISDVLVDGTSVGAVSSYTFSSVTTSHSISATFSQNTASVIPLCPAGTPFDATAYAQDTPQSDPMMFTCNWDGNGQVFISGSPTELTGVYADDGFTIDAEPSGASFDAAEHWSHQHPVLELTSGMTPGSNTFTLIVQNWMGLSMSYGSLTGIGVDQTPYIVEVNGPVSSLAVKKMAAVSLPSFMTRTSNGMMINGTLIKI
jgi:hypothetical protein